MGAHEGVRAEGELGEELAHGVDFGAGLGGLGEAPEEVQGEGGGRYSQFEKLVLLLQRDFPLFLEATGPMPVSTVAAAPACCCRWLTGSPG